MRTLSIQIRKLLFYWHVLHLDKKELMFKFNLAQPLEQSTNDWVLTINQDLKVIDLKMNEEVIFKISLETLTASVLYKVNNCLNVMRLESS